MGAACYRGDHGLSLLDYEGPARESSVNIRVSIDSSNMSHNRNYSCPATKCSNVKAKVKRGSCNRTWTLTRALDVPDSSMGRISQPSLSEDGLKDNIGNLPISTGLNLDVGKTMFGRWTPVPNGWDLPILVSESRSPSHCVNKTDSDFATPKICFGFDANTLHLRDLSAGWMSSESTSFALNEISEVIPGKLYLGCQFRASNAEELLLLGITHILSVTGRINPVNGLEHEHFVMSDYGKTELNTVLDKVYPFMESAQRSQNKLFVHCTLGQNRSPTIVIAFLMKNKDLTLYEAHKMVKQKRRVIQIHQNYAKMLLKLEKKLFGETSLPDDWMEPNGRDTGGIPLYKCEELTEVQQKMFKTGQNVLKNTKFENKTMD